MALLDSRKVVVAAKYGSTVAGADAIAISNEEVRLAPEVATGSFKCLNGKIGNKTVWVNTDDTTVSGAVVEGYLTGNDAVGTALDTLPDWSELYEICGLDETVSASVSVTYEPSQDQPSDSSEVAVWRDGSKRVVTGVMGSLTITGKVGEPLKQSVALSGFTTLEGSAEANPTAVCTDEALLLILKSTDTMTVTSTTYIGQDFTLTQGNDIQKLYAISTKDFDLVDFESSLEITYLKENEDIYSDFADGTEHSVEIQAGTVDGKAFNLTCGQAVVESITESSINMKEAVTVKFNLKGDAEGDDQYAMLWGTMP